MENTEKQNLALIADMIAIAQREFNDNSFIYLLWGWVVSLCCIAEYVLIQMKYENHAIVWAVMIPTAVIQIIVSTRNGKKERVKTHMDKLLGYVWIAVGVCIGITVLSIPVLQLSAYPVLILLYGIGTFISGSIIKLTPMKVGAICCWVIGAVAFHVPFEYQLLLLPLSLILSYIIPGYMLKAALRKMFKELDPLLHSQLRLAVVSLLIAVEEADFTYLKEKTNATSGNLSVQLDKLKTEGYIEVTKSFKNNYPLTTCKITKKGIKAFEKYVENLKLYLNPKGSK